MTVRSYLTPSEAYLATLATLLDHPEYLVAPRGLGCREVLDYAFSVAEPVCGPLRTLSAARDVTMAAYLAAEERLYDSGELRASVWAEEASRFWARIANQDGTINSNYGYLVHMNRSLPGGRTPWEWARDSIMADRDTRQAYVRFALPEHQRAGNVDQVCTLHMNFVVRGGSLHATAVMRSNDVVRGLAYDMPWFISRLYKMAGEVGVPVGTYRHVAHSMHLYERDVPVAKEMLGRGSTS